MMKNELTARENWEPEWPELDAEAKAVLIELTTHLSGYSESSHLYSPTYMGFLLLMHDELFPLIAYQKK